MAEAVNKAYEATESFIFEKVTVESDRVANFKIDIQGVITDLEIYEHLDKPYLTGSIVFVDSANLLTSIDMIGGEKVTVRIKSTRENSKSITKVFFVTNIINAVKVNDDNEIVSIQLVEDVGYYSHLINLSKSFSGKCNDIISQISQSYLQKTIEVEGEVYQSTMKVIVPNMTPLGAMSWIKNKATDVHGYPFFLYNTLVEDTTKFRSLSSMLEKPVLNKDTPFVYWGTAAHTDDEVIRRRLIQSYTYSNVENLFQMIGEGVVGSKNLFINTISGTQESFQLDVSNDVFKDYESRFKVKRLPFDERLNLNGTSLNKLQSKTISQIGGSQAFQNNTSYSEEANKDGYKKRAAARAFNKFLTKSPIDIVVDGYDFIDGDYNTTIGNKLRIQFIDTVGPSETGEDKIDPKRSGDYLIFATRHIFKKEKHDLVMSCVKIGNDQ